MEIVIGIAIYLVIGAVIWKVIGPKLKLAKEKIWGLSSAIGVAIVLLYLANTLNMMKDPFTYIVTGTLSVVVYMANYMFYKQRSLESRAKGVPQKGKS